MKVIIKKSKKAEVTIDPWDTWGMCHTLAEIIHPMLIQIKQWNGIPYVDNKDVPTELQSDNGHCQEKWHWVLDEMIHTFGNYKSDECKTAGPREYNGLRLFGAYYDDLWE